MKKKVLILLLSFSLAMCAGTAAALVGNEIVAEAATTYSDGTFNYTLGSDGTATITGLVNPNVGIGYDLVIPQKVNNYTVTGIGKDAFKNNTYIKSVTFNEGLKTIGAYAFSGCTNLSGDIVFPASLTKFDDYYNSGYAFEKTIIHSVTFKTSGLSQLTIPKGTFSSCSYLESVELPNKVNNIGSYAFSGCKNLRTLTIVNGPNSVTIGDNSFSGTSIKTLDIPASVKTISYGAFKGCEALTTLKLNEGLTTIGYEAFRDCKSLSGDLVIPASVTEFTDYYSTGHAFCNTQISSVSFAQSSTPLSIPVNTFSKNQHLTTVTIAGRINSIGNYAFNECPNLKTLTFEGSDVTTEIGDYAFAGCIVSSIDFPKNILSIGNYAFNNCKTLTTIKLTEGLQTIGRYAFSGCSSLTGDLVIPASVTKLDSYYGDGSTFAGTAITSLTLAPGRYAYLAIPNKTFENCTALKTVVLPERVNSIGNEAFKGCTSLNSLDLGGGDIKKTIGDSAFANSGLKTVEFPANVTSIGSRAFNNCQSLKTVVFNEGLEKIGTYAFADCTCLTGNIVIPSSVTELTAYYSNGNTFSNTNITSVEFLNGDLSLSIPGYAFSKCKNLESVKLSSRVTGIAAYAFQDDPNLTWVSIASNDYIDFTIGGNAFSGDSSLQVIALPKRITSVASNAFSKCTALKDVYVDNSQSEYNSKCQVEASGNTTYTAATFHFNSKGPDTWPVTPSMHVSKIREFAESLYTSLLDRAAEEDGANWWTENLQNGSVSCAYAVDLMVSGDEFKGKNLSYGEIVDKLYETMLGRSADEAGKAYWCDMLSVGITPTLIVNGFAGSPEFAAICASYGMQAGQVTPGNPRDININVTSFTSRIYTKALGRDFEPDGLEYWCAQINSGAAAPVDVAKLFIFSPEFTDKNLSNEEYVNVLYRTFMGREADDGGRGYWVGLLAGGESTRETALDAFAYCPEFQNILASFGL